MYNASDLKKGLKIEIDGAPWVITEFENPEKAPLSTAAK